MLIIQYNLVSEHKYTFNINIGYKHHFGVKSQISSTRTGIRCLIAFSKEEFDFYITHKQKICTNHWVQNKGCQ